MKACSNYETEREYCGEGEGAQREQKHCPHNGQGKIIKTQEVEKCFM